MLITTYQCRVRSQVGPEVREFKYIIKNNQKMKTLCFGYWIMDGYQFDWSCAWFSFLMKVEQQLINSLHTCSVCIWGQQFVCETALSYTSESTELRKEQLQMYFLNPSSFFNTCEVTWWFFLQLFPICNLIPLLHYMSEMNILYFFTPLHVSGSFSYWFIFWLLFVIPFSSSEKYVSPHFLMQIW